MTQTVGPVSPFRGYVTDCLGLCPDWWFFTAAYTGVTFYDDSLYHTYDSQFVSAACTNPGTPSCTTQQIGGGSCSNQSVETQTASNYMYLCSPTYDSLASQLETSPCLSSPADPVIGANSNSPGGDCPSTTTLSSHSAALQAMDYFGANVFSLPVFEIRDQFGYLQCDPSQAPCNSTNSWIRAINDANLGLPNYFTWLNAYNPRSGANLANTIRQGFRSAIKNENPFVASIAWDKYIMGSVYDSLYIRDPLSTGTFFNWMTTSTTLETVISYNGGLSGPPAGTCTNSNGCTFRFTLPTYLTWQDGRQVTAYDVAFSYLSLVGNGAFLGTGGATLSGITILNPQQFDISVKSNGPFELRSLTSLPIIPGYWASNIGGSAWSAAIAACMGMGMASCADVQYTLNGSTVVCAGACTNFPAANMQVNPIWLSAHYSPIASHTFVGSGPWQCGTGLLGGGSGTCTPGGVSGGQAGSFNLSANNNYFRSTTNAARWIWSRETDQSGPALAQASSVGSCFNIAVNLAGMCGHWQQGIGNPGSGTSVSVSTVTTVDSYYLVNWLAPFDWATNPPLGVATFPPVLYTPSTGQAFDGSFTLTPAPNSGTSCNTPNTYYDC